MVKLERTESHRINNIYKILLFFYQQAVY